MRRACGLLVVALAAGLGAAADAGGGKLVLNVRQRPPASGGKGGEASVAGRTVDPRRTAIVVCDMWDDHWCKSAAKRCGELVTAMEPVLAAAREKGVTIIHAPSECMPFYAAHPARKRTLDTPKATPPAPLDHPDPPLPVDAADGGCDDANPVKPFKAWTRQHAGLTIDPERDYVSDKGEEVYSVLKAKGITTVLVMGVHTNMCVLHRSFAIKRLVRWGVDVLLVRDLTDSMYNPSRKPFVPHERGTELIVEFIEANWCPSIESKDLKGK